MKTSVAWYSAAEAATYLGFPSRRAFTAWMHRQKAAGRQPLRVHWLGDRMRFRRVDLDAALEPEPEMKPTALRAVAGGRS